MKKCKCLHVYVKLNGFSVGEKERLQRKFEDFFETVIYSFQPDFLIFSEVKEFHNDLQGDC